MGSGLSIGSADSDIIARRKLTVGLPEDDSVEVEGPSPTVWTDEHAHILKNSPQLPLGISLRAFETWYRDRLQQHDASPQWSPSHAAGHDAMIDLWYRMTTNRSPDIDSEGPRKDLPLNPPITRVSNHACAPD